MIFVIFLKNFMNVILHFFPQNNILDGSISRIRECNVINDEFNALFYYEYIMYLIGKNL